jgi:RNA polymerase sigma factor (sigma-70 family)
MLLLMMRRLCRFSLTRKIEQWRDCSALRLHNAARLNRQHHTDITTGRYTTEFHSLSDDGELSPLEALPGTNSLPEEAIEDDDLQQQLLQAIQSLPARYRPVVLLRYTGQLSFAEISQILAISVATAKTYFQHAKPRLREALEGLI